MSGRISYAAIPVAALVGIALAFVAPKAPVGAAGAANEANMHVAEIRNIPTIPVPTKARRPDDTWIRSLDLPPLEPRWFGQDNLPSGARWRDCRGTHEGEYKVRLCLMYAGRSYGNVTGFDGYEHDEPVRYTAWHSGQTEDGATSYATIEEAELKAESWGHLYGNESDGGALMWTQDRLNAAMAALQKAQAELANCRGDSPAAPEHTERGISIAPGAGITLSIPSAVPDDKTSERKP